MSLLSVRFVPSSELTADGGLWAAICSMGDVSREAEVEKHLGQLPLWSPPSVLVLDIELADPGYRQVVATRLQALRCPYVMCELLTNDARGYAWLPGDLEREMEVDFFGDPYQPEMLPDLDGLARVI